MSSKLSIFFIQCITITPIISSDTEKNQISQESLIHIVDAKKSKKVISRDNSQDYSIQDNAVDNVSTNQEISNDITAKSVRFKLPIHKLGKVDNKIQICAKCQTAKCICKQCEWCGSKNRCHMWSMRCWSKWATAHSKNYTSICKSIRYKLLIKNGNTIFTLQKIMQYFIIDDKKHTNIKYIYDTQEYKEQKIILSHLTPIITIGAYYDEQTKPTYFIQKTTESYITILFLESNNDDTMQLRTVIKLDNKLYPDKSLTDQFDEMFILQKFITLPINISDELVRDVLIDTPKDLYK